MTNPTDTARIIRAPWTPEQVDALNAFQRRGGMHPFTCGGEHTPASPVLVAYTDGWRCPQPYGESCDYRQDWAHAFMAGPAASPVSVVSGQTLRDRAALLEVAVQAIRDAACPGGCGKTEEECTKERIQPLVWHHGRLAAVEGTPEQFAAAVLAVLPPDGHTTDRAEAAQWAADFAEDVAERLRSHHEFERANGALDVMTELRRLAAEAPQPELDDTDLTETDIDRMMAVGTPVQIVTAPPATYAAGVRQQPDTETPSPTDEDFAVAIDSVLDRLLPAIGVSALERTRDQLGGVLRPLVEQLRRERDLAIAHDRQPYPTAWAYEQACKALHRKTDALDRVREFLKRHEHRVAVSPLDVLALLAEPAAVVPAAGAGQDETQGGDRG